MSAGARFLSSSLFLPLPILAVSGANNGHAACCFSPLPWSILSSLGGQREGGDEAFVEFFVIHLGEYSPVKESYERRIEPRLVANKQTS